MKSGDWRQIEKIFQEALQHDPANCLTCRRVFGASLSTDRKAFRCWANQEIPKSWRGP